MRHKRFERLLALSVGGGLGKDEEEELSRHLETCVVCRSELQKLQRLHGYTEMVRNGSPVDEALLMEARRELHTLIRYEGRTRQIHALGWSLPSFAAPVRMGLAAVLMFAVGFGLGNFGLFHSSQPGGEMTTTQFQTASVHTPSELQTKIENVQFLDRGEGSGIVEFTFDAVTPVHMRGNVDDPKVQKVLASALLTDDNPGIRLSAVNALGSAPQLKADSALEFALIKALKSDPNVGVRKQALLALKSMPLDDGIKQAFLLALSKDSNPGIRIAAINALDVAISRPGEIDSQVKEVLQRNALNDKNDYIRLKAKAVLSEKQ